MSIFLKTKETYKIGDKREAYELAKNDPDAFYDSFEDFCKFMDKITGTVHAICHITGKKEYS